MSTDIWKGNDAVLTRYCGPSKVGDREITDRRRLQLTVSGHFTDISAPQAREMAASVADAFELPNLEAKVLSLYAAICEYLKASGWERFESGSYCWRHTGSSHRFTFGEAIEMQIERDGVDLRMPTD